MVLKRFPEYEPYFPHYSEDYLPPSRFFWGVLSTLKKEMVDGIVMQSHLKRMEGGNEDPEEEKIKIRKDIWDAIKAAPFKSSKLSHR